MDGSLHIVHHGGRRTARLGVLMTLTLAAAVAAGPGAGAAVTGGAADGSAASRAAAPLSRVVVFSVQGVGDAAAAVRSAARAVRAAGGRVLDDLTLVRGVTAELPAGARLDPAYRVAPDRPLAVSGLASAPSGPVSALRGTLGLASTGHDGAGVTVAVVDTGVADVADLAGRVTHVDVTGTAAPGQPDGYGHGTFVAGLIAGDGTSSGGAYTGVAPGARILDVRVADSQGATSLVSVLEGLQVVADHPEARVVNLSMSSASRLPYEADPLTRGLEALWLRGDTVVVPAGNDGPAAGTITSPGGDPVLVTAGALDDQATTDRSDDVVAPWSSVGPAAGDVAKPDLVAPGAHLVSLRAPGSVVDSSFPAARIGEDYFRGSGTSFSTAVTSGAAADLLAARGDLVPDQVKEALTTSTYSAAGLADPAAAGSGGLDVAAALSQAVSPVPTAGEFPGEAAAWERLSAAVASGDDEAAASSWSDLSPAARNWAARNWAARNWAARNWGASSWSARNWAASSWSARNWAASSWSARNWSASSWSARNWSASSWSARNWSASTWSARNWSASTWSARNWSASTWSAASWSATSWS